jgi:DnaK suppressor protein
VTAKKNETKKSAARGKAPASATSAAILGRPVSKNGTAVHDVKKVKPEWLKYHTRLMELREQLLAQMNGLAKESAQEMAGYSLHMADSGTDNFDRDFALSLLSADQDSVYEIEEAKPIPKARLEAIPWTRFTVEAQAQLERDGALRQRRLGQLGSVDNAGITEVETDEEEQTEEKTVKDKE